MILNCGVGEDSWESLGLQGDPTSPSKGNQSWIFIRRTDAEAETSVLWPPDEKNWLIGKDPDAGKDWRQEAKGMTEDEMVGWHHQLNGYESEQAPGVGDGQGSLMCCSPQGHKSQTWLSNWTELTHSFRLVLHSTPLLGKYILFFNFRATSPRKSLVTSTHFAKHFWRFITRKGFPGGTVVKNLPANAADSGSIPGSGGSLGKGNGNTLQDICLGNPMDRGACRATVHKVAKESDMT